jgi:hypothetical protein
MGVFGDYRLPGRIARQSDAALRQLRIAGGSDRPMNRADDPGQRVLLAG